MAKRLRWKRFFGLWLTLSLCYLVVTVGYDWAVFGWIDLRHTALAKLATVPFGQSVICWLVFRP